MALLTKAQIIAADDRKFEDVPVPEWGGEVRVLALSGTDRDAYEAAMVDVRRNGHATAKLQNFRAKLVAKCLVNEKRERLFSDSDIKELGAKSADTLDRLFDKARELSGMSDEAVEDAEGNSEAGQNESSTSD